VSKGNLERLKKVGSKKVQQNEFVLSDFKIVGQPDPHGQLEANYPVQVYKDLKYRGEIADRYGIFISPNDKGFLTPYLKKTFSPSIEKKSLLEQFQENMPAEICQHPEHLKLAATKA
jgi:hypothetical protein